MSPIGKILFSRIPIYPLLFFRILFGGSLCYLVLDFFSGNKIFAYYITPAFHFSYAGFDWVKPWPGIGMLWHFYALGLLSLCILVGFCYRIASLLFFLGFTYVFLLDRAYFQNHHYLLCLLSLLMIFFPAHRGLSLDAVFRPSLRSESTPAWPLWLLRFQAAVVYFYGGISKLNSDWLSGEPLRLMLEGHGVSWLTSPSVLLFLSYGGLFFDLGIVPLLLCSRTRWMALALAAFFHGANSFLFHIGVFPVVMMGLTLLYLPAREIACALPSLRSSITTGLIALYALAQIAIPLRPYVFDPKTRWTGDNDHFAWRMLRHRKRFELQLSVIDPRSRQAWGLNPHSYLTEPQMKRFGLPTHFLQFSRFLRNTWEKKGFPGVEITADVQVSYNGRPYQRMIDPTVNLASVEPGSTHWIFPLN